MVLSRSWLCAAHCLVNHVFCRRYRPAVLHEYGYNTYFCWFDTTTSSLQFGLKMGYFFGPLWLFFFLEMFWAYQTYHKLKEVGLEERELNIFKKIMLFPIILLITGTFATARLIYNFATN